MFRDRILVGYGLLAALAIGAASAEEFVVFQRDRHAKTLPDTSPAEGEEIRALRAWAARGETESLAFCVFAREPVLQLQVAAEDLRTPGGSRIPSSAVMFSAVEYVPLRVRNGPAQVSPLRLRPLAGPLDLRAGSTQQFWITLKVPEGAGPGDYEGSISVRAGQGTPRKIPLRLTVYPFRLDPPSEPFFGIFLSPTYLPTLAELSDLKERGFDALLWFWGHYGLRVVNDQGRLQMDFEALDRFLDQVKKAGLKGPIVLALGNDSVGHYERALAQAFQQPLAPQARGPKGRSPKVVGELHNETLNRLYVEGLRQLIERGRSRGWPELVLLPYDEPTEQLMDEYRHRCALIRQHLPGVRIYGVTMNRLSWAEEVAGDSDILVANGDFTRIGELARDRGRGFWTYGSVAALDSFGAARFRYGLAHWRQLSQGVWFWGYNWYRGDPYDEFDAERGDSEWAIVYPPRPGEGDKPIPTVAFEGMREAIDDLRYAATLERLLRLDRPEKARKIDAALEKLRQDWGSVSQDLALAPAGASAGEERALNRMESFRRQVAGWITELWQ